jgi:hypothetical protein
VLQVWPIPTLMLLESKKRQKFTHIAAMRIIFTRIGCTLLTCDMHVSDLRHIRDPVLSSLKMEGIRLLFYVKLNMFRTTHRPSSGA